MVSNRGWGLLTLDRIWGQIGAAIYWVQDDTLGHIALGTGCDDLRPHCGLSRSMTETVPDRKWVTYSRVPSVGEGQSLGSGLDGDGVYYLGELCVYNVNPVGAGYCDIYEVPIGIGDYAIRLWPNAQLGQGPRTGGSPGWSVWLRLGW